MRTWAQLRVDMETLIKEDDVGTSRDKDELRNYSRHHGPDRRIADSRSLHYQGDHQQDEANSDKRQRMLTPMRHDIRAATTPPPTSQPADRPCANCGGPRRQGPSLRQPHLFNLPGDIPNRRSTPEPLHRSAPARPHQETAIPPTRGYLSSSRSARAHETQEGDQSPMTADTTPPTPPLPDQEICPPTPSRTLMTKRSNLSQTSAPPGRPPQTNHTSLQPPRTTQPTQ
jgi:hypothetical protein